MNDEKRIDPEDGRAYSWKELSAFYKGKYTKTVIDAYWSSCKPARAVTGSQRQWKEKGDQTGPQAVAEGKSKKKARSKAKSKLKARPAGTMTLQALTKKNIGNVMSLRVDKAQQRHVAPNVESVAEAYVHQDYWCRGVFVGDTAVGFLMLWDRPKKHKYYIMRFMIDQGYQGYGYGGQALNLLIEHVRTRPGAIELFVSVTGSAGSPGPFYERYGFVSTGMYENDPKYVSEFIGSDMSDSDDDSSSSSSDSDGPELVLRLALV